MYNDLYICTAMDTSGLNNPLAFLSKLYVVRGLPLTPCAIKWGYMWYSAFQDADLVLSTHTMDGAHCCTLTIEIQSYGHSVVDHNVVIVFFAVFPCLWLRICILLLPFFDGINWSSCHFWPISQHYHLTIYCCGAFPCTNCLRGIYQT